MVLASAEKAMLVEFYERTGRSQLGGGVSTHVLPTTTRRRNDQSNPGSNRAKESCSYFEYRCGSKATKFQSAAANPCFSSAKSTTTEFAWSPLLGAKRWWHDQASFYVFTCSQCLESKAIGQQHVTGLRADSTTCLVLQNPSTAKKQEPPGIRPGVPLCNRFDSIASSANLTWPYP